MITTFGLKRVYQGTDDFLDVSSQRIVVKRTAGRKAHESLGFSYFVINVLSIGTTALKILFRFEYLLQLNVCFYILILNIYLILEWETKVRLRQWAKMTILQVE